MKHKMAYAPMLYDRPSRAVFASIILVISLSWALLLAAGPMQLDFICSSNAAAMVLQEWRLKRLGSLIGMWGLMPLAMMLPAAMNAILQVSAQFRQGADKVSSRTMAALQFSLGYGLIIYAVSIAAAFVQWALEARGLLTPDGSLANPVFSGAILMVAGIYQMLIHRQHTSHRYLSASMCAVSAGRKLGYHALGCCLTMIAVQFVAGTMNMVAMVVLTLWMMAACSSAMRRIVSTASAVVLTVAGGLYLLTPLAI